MELLLWRPVARITLTCYFDTGSRWLVGKTGQLVRVAIENICYRELSRATA